MVIKRKFRTVPVVAPTSKKVRKPQKVSKLQKKLAPKILKEAYAQQSEVENEEKAEKFPMSTLFDGLEDVIDDADELSETQSQLDYQDVINEEEDKLLDAFFDKDAASIAKRLSDATITCIKKREDKDDATGSLAETTSMSKSKLIDCCQSLGMLMSEYTHGKMPKAFMLVAKMEDWDSILKLTKPESCKATSMFASSTKPRRFYELFLLPRVREDIRNHKKLHFCLYQSLKKALFKPKEFYSGIIIPLCKSGTCTLTEAVIIGSIIQKVSIHEEFSREALVNLAGLKFCGTTSYFIKVILEKNYALAYLAIDAVTAHFLRFHKETRVMPVIWHQTLLAFVQRYRHELRKEDKMSLRSLLDKQNHKLITPEIVRELDNSRNRGEKLSNSPSAPKPIKEDLFDMPQVPMEED